MMKKCAAVCVAVLVATVFCASTVLAEMTFSQGAVERLRQEYWDNLVNLGVGGGAPSSSATDRNYFRMRTNLWGKADFGQGFGAFLQLTNEAKYYIGDYTPNGARNRDRFDENEVVVDNLYADAKNVGGLPVDLRIGRQNFLGPTGYGEYFLISDGTPNDGSRTFYFNAAKAVVKINDKNTVDLVYITDPKTDTYLPSLYPDKKLQLTGSHETGFVVYGRSKVSDNISLEPYYMYKKEDAINASVTDLKLNTLGMRAVVTIDTWKIRGEFAHQFGDYDGGGIWKDREGNGGYLFFGRKYEQVTMKPEFELGYVYLSGDKPGGTKNEAFDPLFSRQPNWNELMIYTYITETINYGGPIPGYWTNLNLYKAAVKLAVSPDTGLALSYQYLTAPQRTDGLNPSVFSNSGKTRGHLPTIILTHKFSKNVDGMVQAEYFMPRSFYSSDNNGTFLRLQLQVKI